MKKIDILVDRKKFSLETIRYAAYAMSGAAYVTLGAGKTSVKVSFFPKNGRLAGDLKKLFLRELEDEKFREGLFDRNKDLRFWMVKRAINHVPEQVNRAEDVGLTPEQEKELEQLIAQVESEIKKEDPRGITKTWEQKYGKKTGK